MPPPPPPPDSTDQGAHYDDNTIRLSCLVVWISRRKFQIIIRFHLNSLKLNLWGHQSVQNGKPLCFWCLSQKGGFFSSSFWGSFIFITWNREIWCRISSHIVDYMWCVCFLVGWLGISYDGPGGSFHTNFTWNARVTISQKLRMNYIRNSDALHMNFLRSSYKFLMNYTWNHISIFHVNFVCISYVRLVKITRSNAK